MTTREEWLEYATNALEARANEHGSLTRWGRGFRSRKAIASFPGRNYRATVLGDIASQTDGTLLLMVSPLISDALEVLIVLHWLRVRSAYDLEERSRLTTHVAARVLSAAGFNTPFKSVVPTEALIEELAPIAERLVQAFGEYPARDVEPARRATQSTRLLKVHCTGPETGTRHPEYVLRMSASQFDRGAPYCGVCTLRMTLA